MIPETRNPRGMLEEIPETGNLRSMDGGRSRCGQPKQTTRTIQRTQTTFSRQQTLILHQEKKPLRKTIRNAEVDKDGNTEDEEEDEEKDFDRYVDLCVAGTNTASCYNCGKIRHFTHDCKEPKKPFTVQKKPFFKNTKKATELAKTIRNLNTKTREALLNAFQEEGL